jgi:hypothetical protein
MAAPDDGDGRRAAAKLAPAVNENASPVDGPEDAGLKMATEVEQTVGVKGPINWYRLGLLALGALALILLVVQMRYGGAGTAVLPGTPTVVPQAGTEVTITPAPDAP